MKRLAIIKAVHLKSPRGSPKSMAQNRTMLLASLAVLTLQLALPSRANAQVELSLSQGISSVLIIDNGMGDTDPRIGSIQFAGSVGAFIGTFGLGTAKPLNGSATQPQLTFSSRSLRTSGQGGTLTILFGDANFGPVSNGT